MGSTIGKIMVLSMAAWCSIHHAGAEELGKGLGIGEVNSAIWVGKALMVERRVDAKWLPLAQVPLRAGGRFEAGEGLSFAVWHEGSARRVEMACGANEWAWEGLRPGASAQLEFACGAMRYRAQVGSVGMGSDRLSLRSSPQAPESAAVSTAAHEDDAMGRISTRAKLVAEAIEAARLAAKSIEGAESAVEGQADALAEDIQKASPASSENIGSPALLPVNQPLDGQMGLDGADGLHGPAKN